MKKANEHEIEKMLSRLSENGAPASEDVETNSETDAQSQTASDDANNKEAEFEKLIKGEFKKQFDERMKENLKRRFKESSQFKLKALQNEKIIDLLMQKYGLDEFDAAKLTSLINSDKALKSNETGKASEKEDILRRIEELELENEKMKKQREEKAMQETIKAWIADGESLKESYPDFDIEIEAENPEFLKLLKAGAGLKNAYLAMHHDEIVDTLVEKAAKEAMEKTAQAIKTRGQRPLENGMTSKSTALFKTDVSKLSPAQRAEIAKRVAKGEIISF